jgi:hypothetical protein
MGKQLDVCWFSRRVLANTVSQSLVSELLLRLHVRFTGSARHVVNMLLILLREYRLAIAQESGIVGLWGHWTW